jgi:hypothetical protein
MPGDPNRHRPGPAPGERSDHPLRGPRAPGVKNPDAGATRTDGRTTEESRDPGREANHIESSGHVERDLPDSVGDALDADEESGLRKSEGKGRTGKPRAKPR